MAVQPARAGVATQPLEADLRDVLGRRRRCDRRECERGERAECQTDGPETRAKEPETGATRHAPNLPGREAVPRRRSLRVTARAAHCRAVTPILVGHRGLRAWGQPEDFCQTVNERLLGMDGQNPGVTGAAYPT